MDTKIENKIKESMAKYNEEHFELYKAEAGWEDWMEEYTEAEDGEECTERELKEIEKIQEELWCEVHNYRLMYDKIYIEE